MDAIGNHNASPRLYIKPFRQYRYHGLTRQTRTKAHKHASTGICKAVQYARAPTTSCFLLLKLGFTHQMHNIIAKDWSS